MDLLAIEEIKRLKHRYFRSLDLKEWDAFGDCLAVDVEARYGTHAMKEPLHFDTRAAVVAYMAENLHRGVISMHVASHAEIDVDGDAAVGTWAFEDTVVVPDFKVTIRGAGYYRDRYRRDPDGRWRIAATGYDRVYEALTSHDDTPSLTLLANRWA